MMLYSIQRQKNPLIGHGTRKYKHFQFLTDDVGDPKLIEHFGGLLALGKVAPNWRKFKEMVNRALPRYDETIPMDLEFDDN